MGRRESHAECAALVVQLPGVVLLCDPVALTAGEAGKLETPVSIPCLSKSTPAAEEPHFAVFLAKPRFGAFCHCHLPIRHPESLYHLPLVKTSPAALMWERDGEA